MIPASSPSPTHLTRLTLQLLVTKFPLNADGGCPVVNEALEAGILALLHGAAGRVDGDDRAIKAWRWGGRSTEGWAQQGWVGSTPLPQLQSPLSPAMASATLTVGGACRFRWDSDCEGGLLLRACIANDSANVLAGIGWGDVVKP